MIPHKWKCKDGLSGPQSIVRFDGIRTGSQLARGPFQASVVLAHMPSRDADSPTLLSPQLWKFLWRWNGAIVTVTHAYPPPCVDMERPQRGDLWCPFRYRNGLIFCVWSTLKHILDYAICHLVLSGQFLLKDLDSFVVPAALISLVPLLALAFPGLTFPSHCKVGVPCGMVGVAHWSYWVPCPSFPSYPEEE